MSRPGWRAHSLNIAFVIGDIHDPTLHAPYEVFAAAVVKLVATGLTAALVWIYAVYIAGDGYTPGAATIMVSMAAGALLANLVSVWLLVVETVSFTQR